MSLKFKLEFSPHTVDKMAILLGLVVFICSGMKSLHCCLDFIT